MPSDLGDRLDAVKELLAVFRLERMVYLVVTCCSLGILFACAIRLFLAPDADITAILGIVTGSGGILYTTGRLLKMWSDALRMLGAPEPEKEPA